MGDSSKWPHLRLRDASTFQIFSDQISEDFQRNLSSYFSIIQAWNFSKIIENI